jgi:hypothetical protein
MAFGKWTIKGCGLVCWLLLLTNVASAEIKNHRCSVSIVDFNTDYGSELGKFVTVVESDKTTIKAFQLPGTKLFVTAGVLYLQKSPYTKSEPPYEIRMTLILAKKAYLDTVSEMDNSKVLTIAIATAPLKSFETATVETAFLGKKQPVYISLECTN